MEYVTLIISISMIVLGIAVAEYPYRRFKKDNPLSDEKSLYVILFGCCIVTFGVGFGIVNLCQFIIN